MILKVQLTVARPIAKCLGRLVVQRGSITLVLNSLMARKALGGVTEYAFMYASSSQPENKHDLRYKNYGCRGTRKARHSELPFAQERLVAQPPAVPPDLPLWGERVV